MSRTSVFSTIARLLGATVYAVLTATSYLICTTVGFFAIFLTVLFVFPDPCLPFCVTAETRGGGAEETGAIVVGVGAALAYLGALHFMRRRWGRWIVLLIPAAALLAIVPVTIGALLALDALTPDQEALSCNC